MKKNSFSYLTISFLCLACFTSCQWINGQKTDKNIENDIISMVEVDNSEEENIEKEETKIQIDTLRLPIAQPEGISLEIPGMYREYELDHFEPMLREEWYSLFKDSINHNFYLEKAQITVVKDADDCMGIGETATFLRDKLYRRPYFFIKGLENRDSIIKTFTPNQSVILPNENYSFEWENHTYKLRGEGIPGELTTHNYKLYLSIDGSSEQLLVAIPSMTDTNLQILFIGDLDEDGKPDFLFDTSSWYEEQTICLFLSSKARDSEIVRCVGIASYGFDC